MSKKKVLVIVAHADDMEYQIGGTILKMAEQGYEIHEVIATYNDCGSYTRTKDDLVENTKKEMISSAKVLGIKGIIPCGFPDGLLRSIPFNDIREKFIYEIRRIRPDVVMTWDPIPQYVEFQDHNTVGEAATEAANYAQFPLFCPHHKEQGLEPWFVKEICHFGQWFGQFMKDPNLIVDITPYLDKKLEALSQYRCQTELLGDGFFREAKVWGLDVPRMSEDEVYNMSKKLQEEWVKEGARKIGSKIGVRYAEQLRHGINGIIAHMDEYREKISVRLFE